MGRAAVRLVGSFGAAGLRTSLSRERLEALMTLDTPRSRTRVGWPVYVLPAGYHLFSSHGFPLGPSIFHSIFQKMSGK